MSYNRIAPTHFLGPGYEHDRHLPMPYQPLSDALGQAPTSTAPVAIGIGGAGITMRQVAIGLVVVVIVALVLRELMKAQKQGKKLERNEVVTRISTKELAQRLYERLDAKGRANPQTMRSLERLAR